MLWYFPFLCSLPLMKIIVQESFMLAKYCANSLWTAVLCYWEHVRSSPDVFNGYGVTVVEDLYIWCGTPFVTELVPLSSSTTLIISVIRYSRSNILLSCTYPQILAKMRFPVWAFLCYIQYSTALPARKTVLTASSCQVSMERTFR